MGLNIRTKSHHHKNEYFAFPIQIFHLSDVQSPKRRKMFHFILFFIFIGLFFYLFLLLLRFLFFRVIKHKVGTIFHEDFLFVSGKSWLSIGSLRGHSEFGSIDIQNLSIVFHPIILFSKKKYAFIQVTADKLSFSINSLNIKQKTESTPFPIEKWIFIHILTYLLTFFIRTVSFFLQNVEIKINGILIKNSAFLFQLDRKSTEVKSIIKFFNISLIHENIVIFHIPKIAMNLQSTVQLIPYFLTLNFDSFHFKNELINIDYNDSHLFVNLRSFSVSVPTDDEVHCNLIVDPIHADFFKTNLYTKSFSFYVTSLNWSIKSFTTGMITASRNNCPLGTIEYTTFSKFVFSIAPCELTVAMPLIIDIAVIGRKFSKRFGKSSNSPTLLKKFQVYSSNVIFNLNLSDAHVLQFNVVKPRVRNMVLYAKSFTGDVIFPGSKHQVINGQLGQLNFDKPNFSLKVERVELALTVGFAENDFIKEMFELFSFIDKQMRGITLDSRALDPPTRRIMSLEAKYAKFIMVNFPLTLQISKSQEAKRSAMQHLLRRQEKAINILQVKKIHCFNEDEFNKMSRTILYKLFRGNTAEMKNSEVYLYKGEGENITVILNGPAVPNKKSALEMIENEFPGISNENVGKVAGGLISLSATYINVQLPNLGEVIRGDEIKINGYFFACRRKGEKKSDFYISRNYSDNGQTIIDIPLVSSRSVSFVKLTGNFGKAYSKATPAILEFFQDNKIATSIMRKKKFKFNRIGFFDMCRIIFQVHFDFNVKELNYGYNDGLRAFKLNDYAVLNVIDCHFTLINGEFKVKAPEMTVKILTDRGYQNAATFSEPDLYTFLPSTNSLNPERKRPFLIPIDSRRILDNTYDPYLKYRTSTYGTIIRASFGNKPATVDADLLISVFEQLVMKHPRSSSFILPPAFAVRLKPRVFYIFTEVEVKLPSVTITYQQNAVTAKLSCPIENEPLHFFMRIEKEKNFEMLLNSKEFSLNVNAFSINLMGLGIKDFNFKIYDQKQQIIAESATIDISSKILSYWYLFRINLPKPNIKTPKNRANENDLIKPEPLSELHDMNNNTDLYDFFSNRKLIFVIPTITLKILMKNTNAIPQFQIIGGKLELRETDTEIYLPNLQNKNNQNKQNEIPMINKNHAKMLNVSTDKIALTMVSAFPLFELSSFQLNHAYSNNRIIDIIEIDNIMSNVKSDDIDFIKSSFHKIKSRIISISQHIQEEKKLNKIEASKPNDSSSINENNGQNNINENINNNKLNPNTNSLNSTSLNSNNNNNPEKKQIASVRSLCVRFIQEEGTSLLTVRAGNIAGKRVKKNNNATISSMIITKFDVVHDLGTDMFKNMIEMMSINLNNINNEGDGYTSSSGQNVFFKMLLEEAPLKMKFPVFERVEVYIGTFFLRISLPFIRQFRAFFPTAETIQMLDLEQESEEVEEDEIEFGMDDDESSAMIIEEKDENSMFIQKFIFHSFDAELSFRRKAGGAFSEFLHRPLNFKGLQRYDIFGTQKQLTTFVRRTLTRTAIMSLPKMFFSKNRPQQSMMATQQNQKDSNENEKRNMRNLEISPPSQK
ncbi:hypothetical protein TRFO_06062 [Tritrichomonas foetus]|uniref:Uncharacterized protein n=1 Tax=Tritrichomonas foetus TaxID=1144522 RepID=A0A1J4K5R5_9EUKA|nr:hypothetical protein TRFO_06062 [Tritrichomonas foetus]|eukprot:OHT05068.1 hypothetical protein TRFO_06062 [Tritrichomonas foetus]